MKKAEQQFLIAFDASLGISLPFEKVESCLPPPRRQTPLPHKKRYAIAGMVASFVVIMAILIPSAVLLRPADGDAFDSKNITLQTLRESDCLFYEDLVFAQGEKNHVFVTDGERILAHYAYEKATYHEGIFERACNMRVIEAVEYIGIPSYAGISGELSLDYSFNDGYLRRLKLCERDDGLYIDNVELLNKEDPTTWFDPAKTDFPSRAQCEKICVGMSLDEVVFAIGKPQRDVGYGARLFQFDLDDGSILCLRLDLDVEKENKYVHNNPENKTYGTHCLYVADIGFIETPNN